MAGGYLLIVSLILDLTERGLNLTRGMPQELLESTGISWTLTNFVIELLFYVIIPTLGYSFFYLVIPLSGVRAGLGGALFAFLLGAAPTIMALSVRIKLPVPYLLFLLLAFLIKLGGCLAIVGYLYTL
jgi:hypothetical protein